MGLSAVLVCQDVGVQVPVRRMFFYAAVESNDGCAAVKHHLTVGLWVVRRGEAVFNSRNLGHMLEKRRRELRLVIKKVSS